MKLRLRTEKPKLGLTLKPKLKPKLLQKPRLKLRINGVKLKLRTREEKRGKPSLAKKDPAAKLKQEAEEYKAQFDCADPLIGDQFNAPIGLPYWVRMAEKGKTVNRRNEFSTFDEINQQRKKLGLDMLLPSGETVPFPREKGILRLKSRLKVGGLKLKSRKEASVFTGGIKFRSSVKAEEGKPKLKLKLQQRGKPALKLKRPRLRLTKR